MKEFICRQNCAKCCTGGMVIPVTLGDLYRQWVYTNEIRGQSKTLYEVFDERFEQRGVDGNDFFLVLKMPCRSLDIDTCSVHGVAQYLSCSIAPEGLLLPEYSKSRDVSPYSMVGCIDGTELSQETQRKIRMLNILFDREWKMTDIMANSKKDLRLYIEWISGLSLEEFMECMWPNIGPTQFSYMEILGISNPDYSSLDALLRLFKLK